MNTTTISPNDRLTVSIALTSKIHERARRWAIAQNTQPKAKQVYLNTLAVYAVDRYLRDFLIETDIEAGDSWSPGWLSPPDVADLVVPNVGRLECRPVIEDATEFQLPESAWDDRVAYVAVRFRESLQAAELVGYLPVPEGEPPSTIALSQLQPIADLLEHIHCLANGNRFLAHSDAQEAAAVREIIEYHDLTKIVARLERIFHNTPASFRPYAVVDLFRGESKSASEVGLLVLKSRGEWSSLAASPVTASNDEEITEEQAEATLEELAERLLAKLREIWGDRR